MIDFFLVLSLEDIHLNQSSFKEGTDIVTADLTSGNQKGQSEHYRNRLLLERSGRCLREELSPVGCQKKHNTSCDWMSSASHLVNPAVQVDLEARPCM